MRYTSFMYPGHCVFVCDAMIALLISQPLKITLPRMHKVHSAVFKVEALRQVTLHKFAVCGCIRECNRRYIETTNQSFRVLFRNLDDPCSTTSPDIKNL